MSAGYVIHGLIIEKIAVIGAKLFAKGFLFWCVPDLHAAESSNR
jgi:hypothetical protein